MLILLSHTCSFQLCHAVVTAGTRVLINVLHGQVKINWCYVIVFAFVSFPSLSFRFPPSLPLPLSLSLPFSSPSSPSLLPPSPPSRSPYIPTTNFVTPVPVKLAVKALSRSCFPLWGLVLPKEYSKEISVNNLPETNADNLLELAGFGPKNQDMLLIKMREHFHVVWHCQKFCEQNEM